MRQRHLQYQLCRQIKIVRIVSISGQHQRQNIPRRPLAFPAQFHAHLNTAKCNDVVNVNYRQNGWCQFALAMRTLAHQASFGAVQRTWNSTTTKANAQYANTIETLRNHPHSAHRCAQIGFTLHTHATYMRGFNVVYSRRICSIQTYLSEFGVLLIANYGSVGLPIAGIRDELRIPDAIVVFGVRSLRKYGNGRSAHVFNRVRISNRLLKWMVFGVYRCRLYLM